MDTLNEVDTTAGDNWLANAGTVLRQRWWLVAGVPLIALVAAVIYLRGATYAYTAELRVYPAPSSPGQSQAVSGLSGLASLAGIGGAAVADSATPFRLFLDTIRVREVAERLARDRGLMHQVFAADWDGRQWRERRSLGSSIKHAVWGFLGLPITGWRPPDAATLQSFIVGRVGINQSVKTPVVSLSLDSADPRFAVQFLTKLNLAVDGYLRERQQARTRSNIAWLSARLAGVTLIEQRQALFAALAEQERQAMLANSDAPYAAVPLGVATASDQPSTPRQIPLLLAALVGGLVAGTAVALLLGLRRRTVAVIESA